MKMKKFTHKITVWILIGVAAMMLFIGVNQQTARTVNEMRQEHIEWVDSAQTVWDSIMPVSPMLRDIPIE